MKYLTVLIFFILHTPNKIGSQAEWMLIKMVGKSEELFRFGKRKYQINKGGALKRDISRKSVSVNGSLKSRAIINGCCNSQLVSTCFLQ